MSVTNERHLRVGRLKLPLPQSRRARTALGLGLIGGGCLFVLPVFGLWMIPAGVAVLAVDSPAMRRFSRKGRIWWGRHGRATKPAGSKKEAGQCPASSDG